MRPVLYPHKLDLSDSVQRLLLCRHHHLCLSESRGPSEGLSGLHYIRHARNGLVYYDYYGQANIGVLSVSKQPSHKHVCDIKVRQLIRET